KSDVDKARAIYEWIVDNTFRDPKTRGCGVGDVKSLLESGNLGGKCADLNALYVGLARSVGVPARDVYGVRVAPSKYGYKSLGAEAAVPHVHQRRSRRRAARPAGARQRALHDYRTRDHGLVLRFALAALLAAAAFVASAAELKPWDGGATPPLALEDMKGQTHELGKYKGKVVLVNFWATWCEPCRAEMPSIDRLRSWLKGKPFEVLAVHMPEPLS